MDGCPTLPPLWIADQVRNDGARFSHHMVPAYAGMMLGFDELYYLGVSMSTVTPMSMYLFRSAGLYDR